MTVSLLSMKSEGVQRMFGKSTDRCSICGSRFIGMRTILLMNEFGGLEMYTMPPPQTEDAYKQYLKFLADAAALVCRPPCMNIFLAHQ